MGNCNKGETRTDIDNMQPKQNMNAGHEANDRLNESSMSSSTHTYTSSFGDGGPLMNSGKNTEGPCIEDF